MGTYSFQDVSATFKTASASINLGAGSANAEEGITIEPVGNKNTRTMAADGKGMNSMDPGNPCDVMVRLLQTSPVNALLMEEYNTERANSTLWGQGIFMIRQAVAGDVTECSEVAYQGKPKLSYSVKGTFLDWKFEAISHDTVLGTY